MKNIVVVGIPHPSEKNLFLHGQRRDNNLWSSVAGHAHEGEELAEAAKREMNEETGIQSSDIKQVNQQDFDTMHGPIKVTLFICPTASGELTPKNDPDKEFSKYAWLDPTSERDDWHVPPHKNLLAKYAQSLQKFEQLGKTEDFIPEEDSAPLMNRIETKYFISRDNLNELTNQLKERLKEGDSDTFVRFNTNQTIYMDNKDMDTFRDNMDGIKPRFKVRIRRYAPNGEKWESVSYAELKVKTNDGMTKKIRVRIPSVMTSKILSGKQIEVDDELINLNRDISKDLLKKRMSALNSVIERYGFKRHLTVAYNRRAYSNSKIRVTVDDDIRYFDAEKISEDTIQMITDSSSWKSFTKTAKSIKEKDYLVVEVKHEDGIPGWLEDLLEDIKAKEIKFSKYCAAVIAQISNGQKEKGPISRPKKIDADSLLNMIAPMSKSIRDINDAAEFAAYHVSPFMAENDSPESHAKSREKVKREILTAPRKTIDLDVNKAHAALNPVDNGRRPSSKHMKNPIVLGKIGNKHVILDGHHRLIAAKEKGLKSIKAHVLDLPKHHDILLDVEGGHGKFGKSELSKAKITAYHGTPYDFKSFRMPKNPKDLNYGPGLYFSGKPETASDFSTLQVYHPSFDEAYNKYKKSKEYKRHQKVKDPEQRKHLEQNAITNIAGLSPKVMRAELNVKNPYNPYDIEHAKRVSQAAGYPDDFKDFEGHNKEDPHETNFYNMMAQHSLGWNPEKRHSDFYGPKSTYSDRSKKLNSAVRAAGFDAIHDPKEDYHVIFNTKQVKNKSFGKSELDKGAMGDWKKEGYTLHKKPSDPYQGSKNPGFKIIAKDKNGEEVAHAHIVNHPKSKNIWADGVWVDENHRRRGLASAMYSRAEKHANKKIKPDKITQTSGGKKLWAQPRRPFGKSEISHYFNKFLAANPDEDVKIHPNDVMLNAVHRRW